MWPDVFENWINFPEKNSDGLNQFTLNPSQILKGFL